MAGEVVVDALPYIDQGYDDPGVRDAALSMVEEECRRYRPTKNYLEQLPAAAVAPSAASFETAMLRRELERLNARLPPEPLSMKRYELPPPAAGRLSDAAAWTEAVDNSLAQLEHQATRVVNLELQLEYACETWKAYLEVITKLVTGAQARLAALRKETAAVNWERKSIQTAMGSKLRGLEQAWVQLVSNNYCTEKAIGELEVELETVQRERLLKEERERASLADVAAAEKTSELTNGNIKEVERDRDLETSDNGEERDEEEDDENEMDGEEENTEDQERDSDDDERPTPKKLRRSSPPEDMFAD